MLVHVSSCGQRITFVSAEGEVLSTHALAEPPAGVTTEGRNIAYVICANECVAAYRPHEGRVGSIPMAGVVSAAISGGVLYCAVEDEDGGIVLHAFEEPLRSARPA